MKREEHPLSLNIAGAGQFGELFHRINSLQLEGPVHKIVDLMNARPFESDDAISSSYEDFCLAMAKLHREKLYVPPVCVT